MKLVESRNSGEKEFLQAVLEVSEVIIPFIQENKKYQTHNILERLVEPERTILFFHGKMIVEKYKLTEDIELNLTLQ